MISYGDKTFCPYWMDCVQGDTCFRAMKPEVVDRADQVGLPLSMFAEKPECWESKNDAGTHDD